jgi:hypothetical protein
MVGWVGRGGLYLAVALERVA